MIVRRLLLSSSVAVSLSSALTLGANAQYNPAQCATARQQYSAMTTELLQAIGCSTTPKPPKPLQPISNNQPGQGDLNPCYDYAARDAWIQSHPQYTVLQKEVEACQPVQCPLPAAATDPRDQDGDGIPDLVEANLIKRFAPYIRYTKGESNRPIDFITFVQSADLVTPNHWDSSNDQVVIPNKTLASTPLAAISLTPPYWGTTLIGSFEPNNDGKTCSTSAHLAYALRPSKGDWQDGAPWSAISNASMPGMAAHVSPFTPNSPADLPGEHFVATPEGKTVATAPTCALRRDACASPTTSSVCAVIPESTYVKTCKHCIKIEYYQLYGINNPHHAGIANHEGDLSIVTVVYDPDQGNGAGAAVAASHWIHGIEVRYDLLSPQSGCSIKGAEKTCRGRNYSDANLELMGGSDFSTKHLSQIAAAQNNIVIFHADLDAINPTTFEHPEVFVELGSHEFWPTSNWSVLEAPSHAGDDTAHTYIPTNIPNLGEIEHPIGALGQLVVNYRGFWGATADSHDNSSPGASLHTTWNWIVHSPRVPISCENAEN